MMKKLLISLLAFTGAGIAATRNIPLDTAQFSTQGSAPSSPAAGTVSCYLLTSDGKFYCKPPAERRSSSFTPATW
jgi:hypothetical protein